MIGLNGIVSFSRYPLHLISLLGILLSGFAFLLGVAYIALKLAGVAFPIGNPTIVFIVCLFSGIQLLSLGIMGEYVGRIYDEVKRRPKYIVESLVRDRAPARADAGEPPARADPCALPPVCILAGGLGDRLGEHVADTPKPLLEVAGEPFLLHQLRLLRRHGARARCDLRRLPRRADRDAIGDGSAFGLERRATPTTGRGADRHRGRGAAARCRCSATRSSSSTATPTCGSTTPASSARAREQRPAGADDRAAQRGPLGYAATSRSTARRRALRQACPRRRDGLDRLRPRGAHRRRLRVGRRRAGRPRRRLRASCRGAASWLATRRRSASTRSARRPRWPRPTRSSARYAEVFVDDLANLAPPLSLGAFGLAGFVYAPSLTPSSSSARA